MTERVYSAGSTNHQSQDRDYGFVDKRGRKVGAAVTTWEEKFVVVDTDGDEPFCSSVRGTPGPKFVVRCQNTRNGVSYGASNRSQYFDSGAARQEYIDRYLVRSQQALLKQFERFNRP